MAARTVHWVCKGNICRSAAADFLMRNHPEISASNTRSASSGIAEWCGGKGIHRDMLSAMKRAGTPAEKSRHLSRRWDPIQVTERDIVIPMDEEIARSLRYQNPEIIGNLLMPAELGVDFSEIADPYGKGEAAFDRCLSDVARLVDAVVARTGHVL
ncbi:arsenate reductase/protein-tyrosine-phosphatase family protein [Streptomyces rubiginosohelvolus]